MPIGTGSGQLPEWLGRRAAEIPDSPALIVGEQRWSYAEVDSAVTTLARVLEAHGVAAGDCVATLLRNGTHYACVAHALIRLGAVLLPLNVRLTAEELAWQIERSGSRTLLYDADTAGAAQELAARSRALVLRVDQPNADGGLPFTVEATDDGSGGDMHRERTQSTPAAASGARMRSMRGHIDLEAIHSLIFTSGTTGRPKGVRLSYANHWWSAIGSALNLGLHADDRWLACLPLFHVGGLSILLRAVIYGIPVVFPDPPGAAFDAASVNRAISGARITIISVVSTQLQRMLDAGLEVAATGGTLRCVLLGGGPAARHMLEECAHRAIPVVQSYGLTEACSQVATLAPADALRKIGSAGRPLLPTEVRIARLDSADQEDVPESGDRTGEILVRGPTVTGGYLLPDAAEPVSAVDGDGWLHTGDLGYLDSEGYLFVMDRRADLIISGGENVYPAEVEAVLLAHPDVADAGVFGRPHAVWGRVVAAAIVPAEGTAPDAETIRAFAATRLARYKVPAHLEFRAELPRNAAGKLMRRLLAEDSAG